MRALSSNSDLCTSIVSVPRLNCNWTVLFWYYIKLVLFNYISLEIGCHKYAHGSMATVQSPFNAVVNPQRIRERHRRLGVSLLISVPVVRYHLIYRIDLNISLCLTFIYILTWFAMRNVQFAPQYGDKLTFITLMQPINLNRCWHS